MDPEYGYLEPAVIPAGRIPLRLVVEMIYAHKDDPETNTAKVLSKTYNLDLETTFLILEYFQPFNLRLPKRDVDSDRLLSDGQSQHRRQRLLGGSGKKEPFWKR